MQLVHISIKLILKPTAFKNHDGTGMPRPCEFLLKVSSNLKYLADSGDFWDSSDLRTFPESSIGICSIPTPAGCVSETAQGPVHTSATSIVWEMMLPKHWWPTRALSSPHSQNFRCPPGLAKSWEPFQLLVCRGTHWFLLQRSCRLTLVSHSIYFASSLGTCEGGPRRLSLIPSLDSLCY